MQEISLPYNPNVTESLDQPDQVGQTSDTNPNMQQYSRLNRRRDRKTIIQVALAIFSSLVLVIVMITYGFPLLFKLSSKLINLRPKTDTKINSLEVAAVPILQTQYTATPSATVKLTGSADPNSSVTVFQGDVQLVTILADGDGKFSLDVNLNPGQNQFSAQATNESGKKSVKSQSISITNITKAPKLEIESPKDKDNFSNTDGINVKGQTDPGATVSINDHSAIVDNTGKFNYFYRLPSGETKLKFVAMDVAGNKTEKEITVTLSQ